MLSLEEELATTGADAAALAAERRDVFSLFGELRAASYLAVALVTTGVGIWLKNNADRLGPVAILTATTRPTRRTSTSPRTSPSSARWHGRSTRRCAGSAC